MSRGRLAAWVALAAGAGVLVALVVLFLRDFVALGEALAALGVVGGAGWLALTRRGMVRAVAAAVVVVALGAGAVALVARGAVNELIAVAVTLAVFGVASRMALRHAARERRALGTSAGARAASGRRGGFVLLMNPHSGGGKVARFDLVGEARRRGIEPVVLGPGEDLAALAREAAGSAEVIGMAGGDGSQALVAQVALEHELAYVCVPAGTRNHLALDLGLDRAAVGAALDAFASEVERRIDVGYVNGRIFVNNVSLGVYAELVQSQGYRDAKLETFAELLPDLLGPTATPFDLRYQDPARGERRSAQLVLVSNNAYRLDRIAGMGSRPRLDGGRLGVVTVEVATTAGAAELALLEGLGQVRRFSGWREWTAERFEIESSAPVAAGIDGEAVLLEPPLQFRIAPAALRVRLPPHAVGLSPAALTPGLSRSAFRELWRGGRSQLNRRGRNRKPYPRRAGGYVRFACSPPGGDNTVSGSEAAIPFETRRRWAEW